MSLLLLIDTRCVTFIIVFAATTLCGQGGAEKRRCTVKSSETGLQSTGAPFLMVAEQRRTRETQLLRFSILNLLMLIVLPTV